MPTLQLVSWMGRLKRADECGVEEDKNLLHVIGEMQEIVNLAGWASPSYKMPTYTLVCWLQEIRYVYYDDDEGSSGE